MKLDDADLRLSDHEIESLSGLEISAHSIGGMVGSVYRTSTLQHPMDWLGCLISETITFSLLFVLTLPIGLGILRWSEDSVGAMLTGMGVSTLVIELGWTSYRIKRSRSLQTLLHLLDEVDRYHEVLNAVTVLQELQLIRQSNAQSSLPAHFETLQVTRDCLVAGLRTERILRARTGKRSQEAGFEQLAQSLSILKTLSLQERADDYSTLLSQALEIGQSVQEELLKSFDLK